MTPSRPYLIRAIHEWIVDNSMTPHLLVNAQAAGVQAPQQYAENGKLILNIAPQAVTNLNLDNEIIFFNARFSGTPMDVAVPTAAVLAIYARENGQGIVFNEDEGDNEPPPTTDKGSSRPTLKVVK
jgi:stringent starvation protein B